jgi:hypothetical protein
MNSRAGLLPKSILVSFVFRITDRSSEDRIQKWCQWKSTFFLNLD